jgi:hypothetical protein
VDSQTVRYPGKEIREYYRTFPVRFLILNSFTTKFYLGFEFLTAVVIKSTIFWDITPLKFNRRFGSKNKSNRRRRYVTLKRWLTSNGLHGVISQKI